MKKLSMLFLLALLAACSRAPNLGVADRSGSPKVIDAEAAGKPGEPATRRYLALKHQLKLLVPAAALAEHFDAIQAECIKLGCEILSAGQSAEAAHQSASAALSARVPPAAFAGFFSGVQRHGKLLAHQSESEDKTAEVIDVEARIKNLEALKARILELLAKRTGSLKEVMEAEKELSDTQTTLDSMRGQRRVLASQTDMIRIDIQLMPQSLVNEDNWAAPLVVAARDAGSVLVQSVAFLLTASVALLPWALALGVVSLVTRRLWRRRRARKLGKAPDTPA